MGLLGIFDSEETKELKRKKDFEKFLKNGDEFRISLPEIVEVPANDFQRAASTYAFGLVGYAVSNKTKYENRLIKAKIRPVEKGLYIYNATVEGEDMKIPWENILTITPWKKNPTKDSHYNVLNINFVDGRQIEMSNDINYGKELFDFLNKHACGKIEEGWDKPLTK